MQLRYNKIYDIDKTWDEKTLKAFNRDRIKDRDEISYVGDIKSVLEFFNEETKEWEPVPSVRTINDYWN